VTAPTVLAVNSGSSSIKYAVFTLESDPKQLSRGTVDANARENAAAELLRRVEAESGGRSIGGIGHRVVHGGPRYFDPLTITPGVIADLKQLVPFAPNHLPDEIALIEALERLQPSVPQFACFDTGFHKDLPEVSRRLPIPAAFDAAGIRRYGFHGLSYAFLVSELDRVRQSGDESGQLLAGRGKRVVIAHLGNGSSLAAVADGVCIDTSMGFTPIGGIVMSTRTGDLDPGVVTHLARTTGRSPDELEDLLTHQSGLAGISGGISDMRELLEREPESPSCRLAISIYCYEIRKRIGSYAAALGGLDTLVFSGGIGEHAPPVRERICGGLEFLGIALDEDRNGANEPIISRAGARVVVRVIPTNEEIVIARAGVTLLQ
jgi:acetate kinase